MKTVKGLLEKGRFLPYDTIDIPERVEVTVIINDTARIHSPKSRDEFWAEFDRLAVASADEDDLLLDEAFSRSDTSRGIADFEKD